MDFPDHPFWDFAIQVYAAEGVSEACLHLQERHGIDVNIMLFCLWLGASGAGILAEDEMVAAMEASDAWHRDVVRGLRAVRRLLKDGFPDAPRRLVQDLRAQVQRTEIEAEHLEQLLLAGAVAGRLSAEAATNPPAPSIEDGASDAVANLRMYLDRADMQFAAPDVVDFAHILGKAFPGLAPDPALDLAERLL